MFEALAGNLKKVFDTLGRRGRLRPADVEAALGEIRFAMLEADVHYRVVQDFLENVRKQALSDEVSRALNPSQQVLSIVQRGLVTILGEPVPLDLRGPTPRGIMLVGLQGSGKTTTAAKLARRLRSQGERVWLVAVDPYRPAAAEQLQILGKEIDVPVFFDPAMEPAELSSAGRAGAANANATVVLFDTAGRSQLDQQMMAELAEIEARISPVEVLLIADAMTGQEAVRIAQGFQAQLTLTGIILTKMDGDARGGAAISMRAVSGLPIKFIGTGEDRDALESFDPARLVSRILGMGDIQGILEKVGASAQQTEVAGQAEALLRGEFNLDTFAEQLNLMRNMGPLGKLMEMLPAGIGGGALQSMNSGDAERQLLRSHAIIQSMTHLERRKPELLNASRKRRIAAGSGTTVQEINLLMRQYRQIQKVYKKARKRGLGGIMPWFQ